MSSNLTFPIKVLGWNALLKTFILFIRIMKKIFFLLFAFLMCCQETKLEGRPEYLANVCLIVPEEIQREMQSSANVMNKRLKRKSIKLEPNCEDGDFYVLVQHSKTLPEDCETDGCTKTYFLDGKLLKKDVFIREGAQWRTMVHELAHVIGCHHEDLDPPC